MSDERADDLDVAEAVVTMRRRPSIVWLIPAVAAVVGAFVAWRTYAELGPMVEISFETAEGLEAGKTPIKYKDVEVGRVEEIHLRDDLSAVHCTARMVKSFAPYLKDGTRLGCACARRGRPGVGSRHAALGRVVDLILDEAAQKGTGRWTSQNSLEIGALVPTIYAAVEVRLMSGLKQERMVASQLFGGTVSNFTGHREQLIDLAGKALYASKLASYAQGFALLRAASREYGFGFKYVDIARIWRAGCIIRASLLDTIASAYETEPGLSNLLLNETSRNVMVERQPAWREVVKTAIDLGIPMMATSASLAYFDAYRSERLPANLIQAQRDLFGAHTYRRVDKEGVFHTNWE